MPRFLLSPLVRISFGLVMLTISLVLIADFAGFIPNEKKAELQYRETVAEALAVQLSTTLINQEFEGVRNTIDTVVNRTPSILSAAIRANDGSLLFESGPHQGFWTLQSSEHSTTDELQVAIFDENGRWGNTELRFSPLSSFGQTLSNRQSLLSFTLFMASVGFFVYMAFLKKAVHELNSDEVIPERVSKALDTLTEGILIVDDKDFVVFSNASFATLCGLSRDNIVGKRSIDLNWNLEREDGEKDDLPWHNIISGSPPLKGAYVNLASTHGKRLHLAVNATAIGGDEAQSQGMLITFDNVTDIEAKNDQLQKTLGKLQQTQKEVTEQNEKLQILATRDSLTNTLNRRSLFQGLESLISETFWEDNDLSFVMIDIDFFKRVNDNYGHSTGDKVIIFLAECLRKHARSTDMVARFGGEEFCMVLPNTPIEEAMQIAETIRHTVETDHGGDYEKSLKITASFGVSTLSQTASNGETLLEQADQALYVAKNQGRNRVIRWKIAYASSEASDAEAPPALECADTNIEVEEIAQLNKEIVQQVSAPNATPIPASSDNEHTTNHDVLLTDRINQALFRSKRYNSLFAVICLDVEILQRVNDTMGAVVGEKLLNAITTRLKSTVRNTDSILVQTDAHAFSISAQGKREIVLLLTDLDDIGGLSVVTNRIAQSHLHPLVIEGTEYIFSANMGISLFPQDGSTATLLLNRASIAKSEAMRKPGENNVCFYLDEIEQQSKQLIELEAELLRAIERDELVLFFQPKLCLITGELVGLESLVRWQHPKRGLVPPDEFIPLAEKTGLIEDLSRWVVKNVCQQLQSWSSVKDNRINVSINLSPVEFRNPDLAKDIISTITAYGIDPSLIEIEITEAIAVQNMDSAIAMLEELVAVGISMSIDDFGTGYASLSYLQSLPIHKIKIDRSFVEGVLINANDAAIVSAVIAMAHTLGLEVIAEGVESQEQMNFLKDLSCDQIQGYLVSRPMPRDQIDAFIQNSAELKASIMVDSDFQQHSRFAHTGSLLSVLNQAPIR